MCSLQDRRNGRKWPCCHGRLACAAWPGHFAMSMVPLDHSRDGCAELTHEQIIARAATDSQGNSQAMKKGLSTKFPLCAVMMEIAAKTAKHCNDLDSGWVPREENQHADDL
eukprot:4971259-Karenia_brevis.AAC.1